MLGLLAVTLAFAAGAARASDMTDAEVRKVDKDAGKVTLKHGPIALIDAAVPVIVLAPKDALFDKTVSNMQEVMARHGKVLLISDATGVAEAGAGVWRTLTLPEIAPVFAPILYALPAQLLAYHTAIAKGTDVDQPRNLAKSVTVE